MKWNTALYDQRHSFVSRYGEEVLALLNPQPGERVLDVGCGTGHLTQQIAERGAQMVGLDSSPEMITAAREAHPHIRFEVGDAAQFSLHDVSDGELFDAIFSNAALHWVTRMEAAVDSMTQVLRSGGRFVVELGGKGNIQKITRAFGEAAREVAGVEVDHGRVYPSIAEYTTLLEKYGMTARRAELFDRPTQLEDGDWGMRNWLLQFNRAVLDQIAQEMQEAVITRTEEKLKNDLFRDGSWTADYSRLRIVATKD